jgi:tRNA uridine 5-carbamoylmethylation protein Kti12
MEIINILAGPGAGKSTLAAGLFERMKKQGMQVELVSEYAKDMVYEHRDNILADELYILAKQHRKLLRLKDHVNYVITDSPLLFTLMYAVPDYFKSFEGLVLELWNSFDNINIYLERNQDFIYQPNGRIQKDVSAAEEIDNKILAFLIDKKVEFTTFKVEENLADKVMDALFPTD